MHPVKGTHPLSSISLVGDLPIYSSVSKSSFSILSCGPISTSYRRFEPFLVSIPPMNPITPLYDRLRGFYGVLVKGNLEWNPKIILGHTHTDGFPPDTLS